MWLITGLGNPGNQYQLTRHNVGFIAVDLLHRSLGGGSWVQEHKALSCKIRWTNSRLKKEELVLLSKPQTFMNLSGESVQSQLNFYKIPIQNLLVLQDDIDQPFGKLKLQVSRGHGGHNGIRSISGQLGTTDYARLKIGVGRPPHPEMNVADYVLQKFSEPELKQLPEILDRAANAIETVLFEGMAKAATIFNS